MQNNGQLALSGSTVLYNSLAIGEFRQTNATTLQVLFNSAADSNAITAVLQNAAFGNVTPNPSTAVRTATFDLATAEGQRGPVAQIQIFFVPRILEYPAITQVNPGQNFSLQPNIAGSPPLFGLWRLNGVTIRPWTNYFPFFSGPLNSGGSFTLHLANAGGLTASPEMLVLPNVPILQGGDTFATRLSLSGSQGLGIGTNHLATLEAGEPLHAGKRGGRSIWFTWQAPATGIATVKTRGSAFDTLLAVYTGSTLATLVEVASDEDSGGFLTSQVQFNATAGVIYQIAIDGFNGAPGHYVLSWDLEATTDVIPVIISRPASVAVPLGSAAQFTVSASGTALTYQWFHSDFPIGGATGSSLNVSNVQFPDVGKYTVRIRNEQGRSIDSPPAFLETGPAVDALSRDKLEDLLAGVREQRVGLQISANSNPGREQRVPGAGGFISIAAGAIDSKLFSNRDSSIQPGEPNHCGALGGVSQWLAVRPEADGILELDTLGSNLDTILAVYTGSSILHLREVGCDNNGAADGLRSRLFLPVSKGILYLVAVDGVNGASGTIKINWKLSAPLRLQWTLQNTAEGSAFQLSSANSSGFILQSTTDLRVWTSVLTNQSGQLQHQVPVRSGGQRIFFRLRSF